MKKKFLILLILLGITLTCTTGCFDNDELEGSNITATVYPIEYLVDRLYGENSKIASIYPNATNINEYKLTEKQIKDFSKKTNLFVYNGLSSEKELAKTLINKNKNIQIIDVSYGMKYTHGLEEIWLNPSYYLNLANELKTNLKELSSSKYAAEKIEENYKKLEEDLAILDATLRNIGKTAAKNNKNTVVIAYDTFGFLEDYGFNIVNISNENNITSSIKTKFKNKEYIYIFVKDKKEISNSVKDLVDNYDAKLIEINVMETLTDEERNNNDTYVTIMNDFLTNLTNATLS
ncbi:MAG: zinc ABC transporter substrate-binding protein [Bacilli bacterium]|nr:zinc ABC transporter substrate-binding protein [Bacilli bacterium]